MDKWKVAELVKEFWQYEWGQGTLSGLSQTWFRGQS